MEIDTLRPRASCYSGFLLSVQYAEQIHGFSHRRYQMKRLHNWMRAVGTTLTIAALTGMSVFASDSAAAKETETDAAIGSELEAEAPTAEVTGGAIRGYCNEAGTVAIFKGIPYAADAGGENRWKSPQPVEEWEGILDCTEFGASAVQSVSSSDGDDADAAADVDFSEDLLAELASFFGGGDSSLENGNAVYTDEYNLSSDAEISEDCLNLNVWTPVDGGTGMPVIVYIHGGGFTGGGSSIDVYDGEALAENGVVYVSINYRVGIFGYLATSELAEEDGDGVAGNYGLRDQIAALEWVQENIEEFGGDPDNVTIIGQSAGAGSVNALVSSPKAEGLFQNAWAMSFPSADFYWSTQKEKTAEGDALFEGMTLEEMRALSAEELLNNYSMSLQAINIDGVYVPDSIEACLNSGIANDVNYVTGIVPGDTSMFYMMSYSESGIAAAEEDGTEEEYYLSVLEGLVGEYAQAAAQAYPLGEDLEESIQNFEEALLLANAYWITSSHDYGTEGNSYIYYFNHQIPGSSYVFHSSDIGYFLNHFSDVREGYWTGEDYELGETLSSYLINFAAAGDPNGTDVNGEILPEWSAAEGGFTVLGIEEEISEFTISNEELAFWNYYISSLNSESAATD